MLILTLNRSLPWLVLIFKMVMLDFSPLCVFKCVLKLPAWKDAKWHRLHLLDFSPMCSQSACIRRCIVTQVAFVWLFSSVCFHVSLQTACVRCCIITKVAFVCLFSTVHFHMWPQTACPEYTLSHRLHFFYISKFRSFTFLTSWFVGVFLDLLAVGEPPPCLRRSPTASRDLSPTGGGRVAEALPPPSPPKRGIHP